MSAPCRCGRETPTSHLCHAQGYTCPNEATYRLYALRSVSLHGMQDKGEASSTWACDACWRAYVAPDAGHDPGDEHRP